MGQETAAELTRMIAKLTDKLHKIRNTYRGADAQARGVAKRAKGAEETGRRPQMNAQQRAATQGARDHARKRR